MLYAFSFKETYWLTCVTVQLGMDDVDFAVLLCLFGSFGWPCTSYQVISTPFLLQANQIQRNTTELSRPAPLEEHHLIVVWDISVDTDQFTVTIPVLIEFRKRSRNVCIPDTRCGKEQIKYVWSLMKHSPAHLVQLAQKELEVVSCKLIIINNLIYYTFVVCFVHVFWDLTDPLWNYRPFQTQTRLSVTLILPQ